MRAIIFDTETTDLLANSLIAIEHRPHIIEFYAMAMEWKDGEGWTKVDELDFLCKPPIRISEEITRITGIKPEDVTDKERFAHHANAVEKFLGTGDMVVAHNLSYDMAVTDTEFERLRRAIEWPAQRLCTVEATEHLKGYRLSLSALHEELFGEAFTGAHRARVDVEALGRCFVELWNRGEI